MSKSQAKKLAAEKFNRERDEIEAYKEDRVHDPKKYVIVTKANGDIGSRRRLSPLVIMSLAMMASNIEQD